MSSHVTDRGSFKAINASKWAAGLMMSWLEGVLQSQLALRSRPNDDMACSAKLSTLFFDVIIFENSK